MNRKEFEKQITETSDALADALLVTETAKAMRIKLEKKRGDGRGGWWNGDCTSAEFLTMAREHLDRAEHGEWEQIIDCINLLAMARMAHEFEASHE